MFLTRLDMDIRCSVVSKLILSLTLNLWTPLCCRSKIVSLWSCLVLGSRFVLVWGILNCPNVCDMATPEHVRLHNSRSCFRPACEQPGDWRKLRPLLTTLCVAASRVCSKCKFNRFLFMSPCHISYVCTRYCNSDCQKADWGAHKARCKELVAIAIYNAEADAMVAGLRASGTEVHELAPEVYPGKLCSGVLMTQTRAFAHHKHTLCRWGQGAHYTNDDEGMQVRKVGMSIDYWGGWKLCTCPRSPPRRKRNGSGILRLISRRNFWHITNISFPYKSIESMNRSINMLQWML